MLPVGDAWRHPRPLGIRATVPVNHVILMQKLNRQEKLRGVKAGPLRAELTRTATVGGPKSDGN